MTELIIDNEFKNLIPPLDEQERAQLEENILRDGIQDPLKVWNGILIDGHNRYEIAQRHALNFTTVEVDFANRNDAIIWIIKNQFGRRNLSAYDRSILALKLKPVIAAKAKENLVTHTADGYQGCQKSDKAVVDTKKEIAKAAGVSHDTIAKVERIEQQATPEVKAALKAGDLSINAAYNKVKQAKRKEDIQKQSEAIEQQAIEQPDGHNRYAIAQKHNLPFKTVAKVFDDRTDAKIWILKNQLGRRNLIPAVRIKIALLVEQTIAQKAKAKMLAGVKADPTDICPEGSADKPSPKEKRQAVRAEMSALNNLNLTKEVREQKLREGQEIGKLVLLAEARLGEIFNRMPKQQGARTDLQHLPSTGKKLDESDETPKPKLEVAAEMGFNKNQVAQFQKLADNPDAVQKAIDDA